jgi:putative oxidoreductase
MRTVVTLILRILGAGIFIYAGVLKVWSPAQFHVDILGYHMVPYRVAALMAVYLPWLEIFCGLCILFHRAYMGSLAILSGLSVVFIVALSSAWARGIDLSCGCFGASVGPTEYPQAIALDCALLLIFLFLAMQELRATSRDAQARR